MLNGVKSNEFVYFLFSIVPHLSQSQQLRVCFEGYNRNMIPNNINAIKCPNRLYFSGALPIQL